jgi:ATP-dependent helicase Lhr and Lhr-like helicase
MGALCSAHRYIHRAQAVGGAGQDGYVPARSPVRSPALDGFSEATRAWFTAAFAEPTQAQAQAWTSIGNGENALVIAPTGSGKTLAAFLWAIDKLATEPVPADPRQRCRVLYISPLKALAVDIERNLRSPLTGVGHAARRMGLPEPDIRVGVRTGDTAADERRKLSGKPPDILITTPESLFLLLTSAAREVLRSVETVIIDEVHALAGGKRGAHLALSLERLDKLCLPRGDDPPRPPRAPSARADLRPAVAAGAAWRRRRPGLRRLACRRRGARSGAGADRGGGRAEPERGLRRSDRRTSGRDDHREREPGN